MNSSLYVVNEKDKVIGKANSEDVHKKDILHRAVHILVFNSDNKIFCRQRSFDKFLYPGYWSTSIGAHVEYGKEYENTAKEFLKEMLGFDANLEFIGKCKVHDKTENEIFCLYTCKWNKKMRLNPKHIEDGKFLSIEEIQKLKGKVTPHLLESVRVYLKN